SPSLFTGEGLGEGDAALIFKIPALKSRVQGLMLLQAAWQFRRVVRPGLPVKAEILGHVRAPILDAVIAYRVHRVAGIDVAPGQRFLENLDVWPVHVVLANVEPDARQRSRRKLQRLGK